MHYRLARHPPARVSARRKRLHYTAETAAVRRTLSDEDDDDGSDTGAHRRLSRRFGVSARALLVHIALAGQILFATLFRPLWRAGVWNRSGRHFSRCLRCGLRGVGGRHALLHITRRDADQREDIFRPYIIYRGGTMSHFSLVWCTSVPRAHALADLTPKCWLILASSTPVGAPRRFHAPTGVLEKHVLLEIK